MLLSPALSLVLLLSWVVKGGVGGILLLSGVVKGGVGGIALDVGEVLLADRGPDVRLSSSSTRMHYRPIAGQRLRAEKRCSETASGLSEDKMSFYTCVWSTGHF